MNKQSIQKWCKALRSGKYKQTTRKLQSANGFCCLGVCVKEFVPKKNIRLDIFGHLCGFLPTYEAQPGVPEWIADINSDFRQKTETNIHQLNDNEKLTFDEIADCLEAVYIHEVLGEG